MLHQSSKVEDRSEDLDPSKAVLKNVIASKHSIINYEFMAFSSGAVGCVFKFIDNSNFYLFEIGGSYNISKRFFTLRKKINGIWSTIKSFTNALSVKDVPFFGYEMNIWYTVKIEINNNSIEIYTAINDATALTKIMSVTDNQILSGRVGFTSTSTDEKAINS